MTVSKQVLLQMNILKSHARQPKKVYMGKKAFYKLQSEITLLSMARSNIPGAHCSSCNCPLLGLLYGLEIWDYKEDPKFIYVSEV